MAVVLSNHFKYQAMKGEIDCDTDVFKTMLMKDTFTFDEDAHAVYTDVSGEEIGTGYGYTARGITLLSGELTEDDVNNRGSMIWGNKPTWIADGGSIGPVGSAVVFDETSADDTIVGCIDSGVDVTATDGTSIQVSGEIAVYLS